MTVVVILFSLGKLLHLGPHNLFDQITTIFYNIKLSFYPELLFL